MVCGRFLLTVEGETLQDYYKLEPGTVEHRPRYNIAPGQDVPVITGNGQKHAFSLMRWGFVPRWSKDDSAARRLINARAETIDQKPFFRDSFLWRRCLIPADGFYEWKRTGRGKQPMCIRLPDKPLFAFAGIWDYRTGPEGAGLSSCCIITTAANEFMREIHDRMPVILADREQQRAWLDPAAPGDELKKIMRPYQGEMAAYTVSRLVNSPDFDSPECARRIDLSSDFLDGGRPSGFR
ncbi:MAG TPA: SOS response-associated peptidase [Syntrophomonadaceae bacterium]|nr:SOS response-associated peptidase [Syntrophomonadaceae bacterium]